MIMDLQGQIKAQSAHVAVYSRIAQARSRELDEIKSAEW